MMNAYTRFSVFLTLTIACLTAIPCHAQTDGIPCRARGFLGSYDMLSLPYRIEVHESTAFVSTYYGLRIFDVSDPADPVLIGSIDTPDPSLDLAVVGSTSYLAVGLEGLYIIDVSNPGSPSLLGIHPANFIREVCVEGTTAYLSDSDFGLRIVDVSNPSSPSEIGSYEPLPGIFGGPRDVVVEGDTVFAVIPGLGLRVLDVSDPSNPLLIGSSSSTGDFYGLELVGTTAYTTVQNFGLQVFDVSNPAAPSPIGSFETPGTALGLTVSDGLAYLAGGDTGIQIVDVSNPASPEYYGYLDDTLINAQDINLVGSTAYITDRENGLQIYDVTHSATPYIGGSDTSDDARAIAASGSFGYIAADQAGLQIFDINDPTSPVLAGDYTDLDWATGVAVDGTTVYLATQSSGFKILDASDPSSPVLIGSIPETTLGGLGNVSLDGTTAHVITYGASGSFHSIDVSDPTTPMLLRTSFSTKSTGGVAIDGTTAYVAAGNLGFIIMDISDPNFDFWLGNYQFQDSNHAATDVDYIGTTLFGTYRDTRSGRNNYGGFVAVDASDASNPTLLASLPTPGDALNLSIVGNTACVAYDGSYHDQKKDEYIRIGGLALFDVSVPSSPVSLGVWEQTEDSDATQVIVEGTTAYLANGQFGFAMIDVSDCPSCPADLNNDNSLDFFDVSAFLAAFASSDPVADFNDDGSFDFFDVSAFLSAFSGGCP